MFHSLSQFKVSSSSLGKGTYGDVRLATFLQDQKPYALKIINKIILRTAEKQAIQREIEVQSKVNHPNIVIFL